MVMTPIFKLLSSIRAIARHLALAIPLVAPAAPVGEKGERCQASSRGAGKERTCAAAPLHDGARPRPRERGFALPAAAAAFILVRRPAPPHQSRRRPPDVAAGVIMHKHSAAKMQGPCS